MSEEVSLIIQRTACTMDVAAAILVGVLQLTTSAFWGPTQLYLCLHSALQRCYK